MVTKLCAGHRVERNTAFLFGSFQSSKVQVTIASVSRRGSGCEFRGLRMLPVLRCRVGFAQIIDNLVGCSKEEFVSTLSKLKRFQTSRNVVWLVPGQTGASETADQNSFSSNESLIPAQNQRWRRA